MFTNREKLDCARRELAMRIKIYARYVQTNKMSREKAAREIALMSAIVEDYEKLVEPRLDLGSAA